MIFKICISKDEGLEWKDGGFFKQEFYKNRKKSGKTAKEIFLEVPDEKRQVLSKDIFGRNPEEFIKKYFKEFMGDFMDLFTTICCFWSYYQKNPQQAVMIFFGDNLKEYVERSLSDLIEEFLKIDELNI